jgi:hypothetical protein
MDTVQCAGWPPTPRQMKAKLAACLLEPHWARKVCPPGDRGTARAASQNCSKSFLYLQIIYISAAVNFGPFTRVFLSADRVEAVRPGACQPSQRTMMSRSAPGRHTAPRPSPGGPAPPSPGAARPPPRSARPHIGPTCRWGRFNTND